MDTMKKFKVYFFIFLGFFILSTLLTNFLMRDDYKNINYEIKSNSLEIQVTECKAAYSNGYIKGNITNNTDELIPLRYLEINIYDKDGVYVGSEYKELKYFNPKETISFDIAYNYLNADTTVINLTDKIPKKEGIAFFGNMDDEQMKIAAPIAGVLLLFTIIP